MSRYIFTTYKKNMILVDGGFLYMNLEIRKYTNISLRTRQLLFIVYFSVSMSFFYQFTSNLYIFRVFYGRIIDSILINTYLFRYFLRKGHFFVWLVLSVGRLIRVLDSHTKFPNHSRNSQYTRKFYVFLNKKQNLKHLPLQQSIICIDFLP